VKTTSETEQAMMAYLTAAAAADDDDDYFCHGSYFATIRYQPKMSSFIFLFKCIRHGKGKDRPKVVSGTQ
jgi:uncharacterized protein HemY